MMYHTAGGKTDSKSGAVVAAKEDMSSLSAGTGTYFASGVVLWDIYPKYVSRQ
jgi:hypothetical protein